MMRGSRWNPSKWGKMWPNGKMGHLRIQVCPEGAQVDICLLFCTVPGERKTCLGRLWNSGMIHQVLVSKTGVVEGWRQKWEAETIKGKDKSISLTAKRPSIYFIAVLGFELRASCLLGRHSAI
jgi:hypothetical protein